MKRHLLLATMVLFLSHSSSGGEIYKWIDEDGDVYYSDVPKDGASEKVIVLETNIAEPVKIAGQTETKKEDSTKTEVKPVPELTERQKRLEEERVAEEKCQSYYGVSCNAVSHMSQRRQSNGTRIMPQVPRHRATISGGDKRRGS